MSELHLPADYEDLLREFVAAHVDFVLVGGWAVAAHGHGRATDDLDVFVSPSQANASRVMTALRAFGAPVDQHGVTEGLFASPKYGYRMGRKPLQIEILTTIDGVTFEEVRTGAFDLDLGGIQVPCIGRRELLANKRAAGRPKDLADVEALERMR